MVEFPFLSTSLCELGMMSIIGNPILPLFNLYDIRLPCESYFTCYPENGLEKVLNTYNFKKLLGVKMDGSFEECNYFTHLFLSHDMQKMYGYELKDILNDGTPVLIYNGD